MHRQEKQSSVVIRLIIAIIIAIYVLFPFFLVVINSCKKTDDITKNPIGFNGASFGQLMQNVSEVVNNTHFLFWQAFGYSALITILSLVLLAVLGSMA
nr:carbohydrate ABC transporter permease [Butyrivibrio sp.]